ncbi:uncharacterized protein LOC130134846 [Syzygium oleosum]|uniref:uncharacterized protein LOC130134846 n=1 Tax=Syzygium oleosum TaxID=219896 RepID=UPI0024B8D1DF|nr:uncharacterized protein LOC130134846 [Syzygium oleosum]
MADQTDLRDRVVGIEDKMKQVLAAMQQMSAEIKALRLTPIPASPEASALKHKGEKNVDSEEDDDLPDLVDDPVQIIVNKDKPDERVNKLEERVKQLEGSHDSPSIDLSLYSQIKIPKKFKMPDFDKYNGTSCPKAHLQLYHVQMTPYVDNELLMIHAFQASLTGPALNWYLMKKINGLKTWKEVSEAFLKQYRFITDIIPTRDDLERAQMKKNESFKDYAIRWRNIAAQIIPEPIDSELKRINLKDGWFVEPSSSTKRFGARKEKEPAAEVNVTYTQPGRRNANHVPAIQVAEARQQNMGRQPFQKKNNKRQFTPLPGSLSQVLAVLRKKGLLTTEPKRPNPEQFYNYDPSKKCDYHMGEVGHSTDNCFTLKHRIQDLLDTKAFSFQPARPNVLNNPLPDHTGNVNGIFSFDAGRIKNVKVYTTDVYGELVKADYYPSNEVLPLAIMRERISRMVEAGMIVYADHTGIVSTISEVVINWEEEFATLNTGKDKLDPLLEDMPPLEDASDNEEIVVKALVGLVKVSANRWKSLGGPTLLG